MFAVAVSGKTILIVILAVFPGVILIALVVKLWEMRRAKRWPETKGKVTVSRVESREKSAGGPNRSGDTVLVNFPYVEYEFDANGQKVTGKRITIGEGFADFELESVLARYPIGKEVTVYYNPAKPTQAVLERDLDMSMMYKGIGCLMLFFIGSPLIAWKGYEWALAWITPHVVHKHTAPFVTALGGFGAAMLLFWFFLTRLASKASKWPTTKGRVIQSEVAEFQERLQDDVRRVSHRYRTHYKPKVIYEYQVNGNTFHGDRLKMAVHVSSTTSGFAAGTVSKYPVGKEVTVYYNSEAPGEAVLYPKSGFHLWPLIIGIAMIAFAWALATGRIDPSRGGVDW